ncbi:unnamed protein product [Cylindrotheca closterium]|uniref:Uncharacterized protein n=1 Tax=Cylindrotheca closterium TaxID=2856 RepID=A0AAD2G862_9STRA|nr:unnamed protein product [Cylindrotheca closterium]
MGKKKRPQKTKGRKSKARNRQSNKVTDSSDEGDESFQVDEFSSDDDEALIIHDEETRADRALQQETVAEEPQVGAVETETAKEDSKVDNTDGKNESPESVPKSVPEAAEEKETPVTEGDNKVEETEKTEEQTPESVAESVLESILDSATPVTEEDKPAESPEDVDATETEKSKAAEAPKNMFENIGRFFQKPEGSKPEAIKTAEREPEAIAKPFEETEKTPNASEEQIELTEADAPPEIGTSEPTTNVTGTSTARDSQNLLENLGRFFQPKPQESASKEAKDVTDKNEEEDADIHETDDKPEAKSEQPVSNEESEPTTETSTTTEEPKNLLENIGRFFQKPEVSADKELKDATKSDDIDTDTKDQATKDQPEQSGASEKTPSSEAVERKDDNKEDEKGPDLISNFKRLFGSDNDGAAAKTAAAETLSAQEPGKTEEETKEPAEEDTGPVTTESNGDDPSKVESKKEVATPRESAIMTGIKNLFGGQDSLEQGDARIDPKEESKDQGDESSTQVESPDKATSDLAPSKKESPIAEKSLDSVEKNTDVEAPATEEPNEAKEETKELVEDDANPVMSESKAGDPPTAESKKEAAAPRESAIMTGIKKLFGGQEGDAKDDEKEESNDQGDEPSTQVESPDKATSELAPSAEESATADKSVESVAENENEKNSDAEVIKTLRKSSIVANFKNVYEGKEAPEREDPVPAVEALAPDESDETKEDMRETGEEVTSESHTNEKPNNENTESNKEAAAPRESAILTNFRKLFSGQDGSEQGVAKDDPKKENSDTADGQATEIDSPDEPTTESSASPTEESATADKVVDSMAENEGEKKADAEVIKTLRKSSIVANFKNVFEGQEAPKQDSSSDDSNEQHNELAATHDKRKKSDAEIQDDEKIGAEIDQGAKTVRKMSKVSSIKHLFESPKPAEKPKMAGGKHLFESPKQDKVPVAAIDIPVDGTYKSAERKASEVKGDEKPDKESDPGVKAVRKMSKVSSVKHLFESPKPEKDSVASRIIKSPAATGISRDRNAAEVRRNEKTDEESDHGTKSVRKISKVSSIKHLFEGKDAPKQDEVAIESTKANGQIVVGGESSKGDDTAEQSQVELEVSPEEPAAVYTLDEYVSDLKEDHKPETEAVEPRESVIITNFKKFFAGQDTSKHHAATPDPKDAPDDQVADADGVEPSGTDDVVDYSKVHSLEETATESDNLVLNKGSPAEVEGEKHTETAAPRKSMLLSSFNVLFGGQADDGSSRPSEHDDDLSALIDNLDSTKSMDKDEAKQQLRGAVATGMAANMLQNPDKEEEKPTGAKQLRGAVSTVMAANMLQDPDKEEEKRTGAAQLRGAVSTVMAANMLQDPDKEKEIPLPSPTQKLRGAVTTVVAANMLQDPEKEKEISPPSPTQKLRGAVTTVLASNSLTSHSPELESEEGKVKAPTNANEATFDQSARSEDSGLLSNLKRLSEKLYTPSPATQSRKLEMEKQEKLKLLAEHLSLDEDETQETLIRDSVFDRNVRFLEPGIEEDDAEESNSDSVSSSESSESDEEEYTNEEMYEQLQQATNENMEMAEVLDALEESHRAIEVLQNENKKLEEESLRMQLTLEEAIDTNLVLEQQIAKGAAASDASGNSESAKLTATIEELRAELNDLYDQNENLVSQLSEIQRKAIDSKSTMETFGTPTKLPDEFLRTPQAQTDSSMDVVVETFGTPTKLSEEFLRKPQAENTHLVEAANGELATLLAAEKSEKEALQRQLTAMESQLQEDSNKLLEQLNAGKDRNEALKAEVAALDLKQATLSQTLEELAAAKNQNEELKKKAQEVESKQLEENKKLSKVVEEKEIEISKLQNELSDLNEVKAAMDEPQPRSSNRRPSEFEMTALQVQKNRASSEKEKLEETLMSVLEEKDELEASVESLGREKRKLEMSAASFKGKHEKSNQKVESLEAELSEAEEKIEQLGAKSKQQSAELAELVEKISELESSLTELKEENTSLEATLQSTADSLKSEKETTEKTIADLTAQANSKAEENKGLEEKLKTTEESHSVEKKSLEDTVAKMKDQIDVQMEENNSLRINLEQSVADLTSQVTSQAEEKKALEEKLKATEESHAIEKKSLEDGIVTMKGQTDAQMEENKSLNNNLEQKIADLTSQLASQAEETKSLEEKLKSTEESHAAEKKALEDTIAEMKDLTEAQLEENNALHKKLEEALATEIELASVKKADEEKAQKIAELSSEIDVVSADRTKLRSEVDQLSSEKKNLEQQCTGLVVERDALTASLKGKEKELKAAAGIVGNKENTKTKAATGSAPKKVLKEVENPVSATKEPTVHKQRSKVDSNAKSAPSPAKTKAKNEQAIAKKQAPASPGMTAEDDEPVEENLNSKKRGYVKRALNNKYSISTEDKIQQRKQRKKNRENFKGMKKLFLGSTKKPVHDA